MGAGSLVEEAGFEREADEFHELAQAPQMRRRDLCADEVKFRGDLPSQRPIEDASKPRWRIPGAPGEWRRHCADVGGGRSLAPIGGALAQPGDANGVAKGGDETPHGRCGEPEMGFEVRLERIIGSVTVTREELAERPWLERRDTHGAQIFARSFSMMYPKADDREGEWRYPYPGGVVLDQTVAPERREPDLRAPAQVLEANQTDGRLGWDWRFLAAQPEGANGLEGVGQADGWETDRLG